MPFAPSRELIVVPRQVLDGLLTALHLKLSHPTKHQLKLVVRRNFYALDLDIAIERVTDTCHTCMSLLKLPQTLIDQSTTHLPDAIGVTFAADVIKRNRQLIFVIRETVSSYTSTCVVESETRCAIASFVSAWNFGPSMGHQLSSAWIRLPALLRLWTIQHCNA